MSSVSATEQLLKNESGEFCLDSIFCLDFSSKGLPSLGCIPKCVNLCILDLSCNHLTAIQELSVLLHLEELNLNDNGITELGGLEKLENLSKLEVAGNKISSFDSLLPLSTLVNLKFLTLQIEVFTATPPLQLSNPVCQNPNYTKVMSENFPNLHWLDGEAVEEGEPGTTFYKEVGDIMAVRCQGSSATPDQSSKSSPELTPFTVPEISTDIDDDAISKLLEECKESSSKVQRHLDHIKAELKLQ